MSNEDGNKLEETSSKGSPTEQKVGRMARCEYCDKLISGRSLKQHIEEVHFKILQKCPDCGKSYTRTYLKLHREVVHLKKREECQDCGMSFKVKNLPSHRRYSCKGKNKTEMKVMCHLCGKEISKRYLQRHIRTLHTGNAKVQSQYAQCDLCPKRIVKWHMKRHQACHRRVFIKALCV